MQRPVSRLGDRLCLAALGPVRNGGTVRLSYDIQNSDRAVGARLGGMLAREFGTESPPGRVAVHFSGAAGQSFGAFLTDGNAVTLTGAADDYVVKGTGGSRVVMRPP